MLPLLCTVGDVFGEDRARGGETLAEHPGQIRGDQRSDTKSGIKSGTQSGEQARKRAADHIRSDGATSHRRFDDVEHWRKIFDDPARDRWQMPDRIVAALSLKPGMTVADVGAGTGYFLSRLSKAVGDGGTVLAVEVEPNLVEHMRDRAEAQELGNVVPVLGSSDNPRLPRAAVDVVLFVDAYHHVDERRAYLPILKRSLRPDGRVAIIEWKAGSQPVGPKEEDHKLARETVIAEMTGAGFTLIPTEDFLPHQYLVIFE
ncbi:MAG TPA: methyltransferase domain-containing protein [Candidatus Binatia bacterium]|nr:methyltransferase domain-containing protein [Candidatus Binatia bacterium]